MTLRSLFLLPSALALLSAATGCATGSRTPEPPAETLRVVHTLPSPGGYQGWYIAIANDPVWYRPTHGWALPRETRELAIRGEWHAPEKDDTRRRMDTVGQLGWLFPPLFLAGAMIGVDARCRASLALPPDDGNVPTVAIDWEGPGATARAVLHAGWSGEVLATAPCLRDGDEMIRRHPVQAMPVGAR